MDKCNHPKEQREPYHDMTVKCNACNCVIEQFGKPINPPSPLSPRIWPVESSREPACSTARYRLVRKGEEIERGDEILSDDAETWVDLAGWEIGTRYDPALFVPARRKCR